MSSSGDHRAAHNAHAKTAAALQSAALAEARRLARGVAMAPSLKGFASGAALFDGLFSTPAKPARSVRVFSSAGMKTFHMRVTPIVLPPAGGEPRARGGDRGSPPTSAPGPSAAAHAAYVERIDAVERAAVASVVAAPGQSAALAEGYITRDGALEMSTFGTIAPTLAERQDFWRQVEASERKAGEDAVVADFRNARAFADIAASDPRTPGWIRDAALARKIVKRPFDEQLAADVETFLASHNREDGPQAVRIAKARAGRVQHRIVLELPCDMTPAQRLEIAKTFCASEFEDRDAPYHCALHAPSGHNDSRNFHLHIVFHDRPAKKIADPDTGQPVWDFAYAKTVTTSSRHKRVTHPFRQPKIRAFSDRNWIKTSRANFAAIVNDVRAKAEQAPLYDPRSYKDMGVPVEPLPSLTRQEYFDALKGRDNPDAIAKLEKRWERAAYLDSIAAGPVPVAGAQTPAFRQAEQEVARRAPASLTSARLLHGRYVDALERGHAADLDGRTLDLIAERISSAAHPPLAGPRPSPALPFVEAGLAALKIQTTTAGRRAAADARALAFSARDMTVAARRVSAGSLSLPSPSMATLAHRMGLQTGYAAAEAAAARAAEQRAARETREAEDIRLAAQDEERRRAAEARSAAHALPYPVGHPFYPDRTPIIVRDEAARTAFADAIAPILKWGAELSTPDGPLIGFYTRQALAESTKRQRLIINRITLGEQQARDQLLYNAAWEWRAGRDHSDHPSHLDPDHPYTVSIVETIAAIDARMRHRHMLSTDDKNSIQEVLSRQTASKTPYPYSDLEARRSDWSLHADELYIADAYFPLAARQASNLAKIEREAKEARKAEEARIAADEKQRRLQASRAAEAERRRQAEVDRIAAQERARIAEAAAFAARRKAETAPARVPESPVPSKPAPDAHASALRRAVEDALGAPPTGHATQAELAAARAADQNAARDSRLRRGVEAALSGPPVGRASPAEIEAAIRAAQSRAGAPEPTGTAVSGPIKTPIVPDGASLVRLRLMTDPLVRQYGEAFVNEAFAQRPVEIEAWGEKTIARTYRQILATGARIDVEWRRRNPGKTPPTVQVPSTAPTRDDSRER